MRGLWFVDGGWRSHRQSRLSRSQLRQLDKLYGRAGIEDRMNVRIYFKEAQSPLPVRRQRSGRKEAVSNAEAAMTLLPAANTRLALQRMYALHG
nr:hypothetical protein CFP56_11113 [Quercus suber]